MEVKVTNIEWDTDNDEVSLPSEIDLDIPNCDDEDEQRQYISDKITEMTGFCHFGFTYEEISEDENPMKLNGAENYESFMFKLDPVKHPIAYGNRVKSLMTSGLTEKQAKALALEPIEMEVYYVPDGGLFSVESEAVESGTIYCPYSGDLLENPDIE